VQLKVATFGAGEMPFPYAPAFLLLTMPFGLLPYPAGLILWSLVGYAIYLLIARRLSPEGIWVAAAFPPVFANAALGQNGFFMAVIFLAGLLLLERRPFLAGLVLGCLILKPQLALLLPVATIAARQWRTIAGAILSSVAVMLL